MKNIILPLLFLANLSGVAQTSCNHKLDLIRSDIDSHKYMGEASRVKTLYHDPEEFYSRSAKAIGIKEIERECRIQNSDSLESSIINNYPKLFSKDDQCITMLRDTLLIMDDKVQFRQLCNKDYEEALRGGTTYSFVGKASSYVIIYETGYESFGYYNADLVNGKNFGTLGFPIFLTDSYVFSIGNYYGAMEIIFLDLESRIMEWGSIEAQEKSVLIGKKSIFIEFTTPKCRNSCQYMEIQFSTSE